VSAGRSEKGRQAAGRPRSGWTAKRPALRRRWAHSAPLGRSPGQTGDAAWHALSSEPAAPPHRGPRRQARPDLPQLHPPRRQLGLLQLRFKELFGDEHLGNSTLPRRLPLNSWA